MAASSRFVEVALPLPIDQLFTYSVTDDMANIAQPGCRVFVSFRNRLMTGVITGLLDSCTVSSIKPVLEILDTDPIMNADLLELTRWISQYYLCAWGEAIRTALPAGLLNEAEQLVEPAHAFGCSEIDLLRQTAPRQADLLQHLTNGESTSVSRLKRELSLTNIFGPLRALETKGYITLTVGKPSRDPGPKFETWIELIVPEESAREAIAGLSRRAPKQASCINLLLNHGGKLAAVQLRHLGHIERRVINELSDKGLVRMYEVEVMRDPFKNTTAEPPTAISYTREQSKALSVIEPAVEKQTFHPILLYGVTGSGKTHVYIRAIEKTLEANRGAIVLVPELALTPQAVRQFRSHFGDLIAVLHSGLSAGERYDSWRGIREGRFRIVVGARSAIFAPVHDLGLIVVDEEHETSYKQFEDPPLYHARDVAVVRARIAGAVALLGSATPSLESYNNTQNGKFICCELSERVDQRAMPKVSIVDMKEEHDEGNWEIFSRELMVKIEERLHKQEQIILFLNRRGFSTFLLCSDCGHAANCPNCSVTMTYHADSLLLRCHYCDHRINKPEECSKCHSRYLKLKGIGTQKVEEELKQLFPEARIARMDMDTTTRKHAHREIFEQFLHQEADILLGTQMVTKGFDFPHVTLVGVISADTTLNLPDFRASERTFQQLTQVAGRTGRGHLGGEVVIQTYAMNHHSILTAQNHDYGAFYEHEIEERRELSYPPFGRMVGVLFQGANEKRVKSEANRFGKLLQKNSSDTVILGPAASVVSKIRGMFRYHLVARSANAAAMRYSVQKTRQEWESNVDRKQVQLRIDVDPVGLI